MPRKPEVAESRGIFEHLNILVFPALIAAKRLALFESQIRKAGGCVLSVRQVKEGLKPSYVVVDESFATDATKVRKLFAEQGLRLSCAVVTTKWLSVSLKNGAAEPKDNYEISGGKSGVQDSEATLLVSKIEGTVCGEDSVNEAGGLKRDAEGVACSSVDCGTPPKRTKVGFQLFFLNRPLLYSSY